MTPRRGGIEPYKASLDQVWQRVRRKRVPALGNFWKKLSKVQVILLYIKTEDV